MVVLLVRWIENIPLIFAYFVGVWSPKTINYIDSQYVTGYVYYKTQEYAVCVKFHLYFMDTFANAANKNPCLIVDSTQSRKLMHPFYSITVKT